MKEFNLALFALDDNFPFHIMFDKHEDTFPMHRHIDFHELVIVTSGTATHIIDGEMYSLKKGDVFVVGTSAVHGYVHAEDFNMCNIMFRMDSFFKPGSDITKLPSFHALFAPYLTSIQGFSNRFTLSPGDYIRIYGLIHNIMNEYNSAAEGRRELLRSYFMQLAVTLIRLYGRENSENPKHIMNAAAAAAYIEHHYTEKITVTELAKMSHYSPRHFMRIFSDSYHTTPQKYILSLRLRHACMLLRETDLSIEDTALQSGFGDGNYFSRIFRQHFGITPREYRTADIRGLSGAPQI